MPIPHVSFTRQPRPPATPKHVGAEPVCFHRAQEGEPDDDVVGPPFTRYNASGCTVNATELARRVVRQMTNAATPTAASAST
jgi:hypothetical protein